MEPKSKKLNVANDRFLVQPGISDYRNARKLLMSYPPFSSNNYLVNNNDMEMTREFSKTSNVPSFTLEDVMCKLNTIEQSVNEIRFKLLNNSKQKNYINPVPTDPICYECKNIDNTEDSNGIDRKIEIGEHGSGILISDMQWTCAVSKPTYTAMATSLLIALFDLETLLNSNLRGGRSKIIRNGNPKRVHVALDERIIKAIKYTVQRHFPKTYTDGGFGHAINGKLTALRRTHAILANSRAKGESL